MQVRLQVIDCVEVQSFGEAQVLILLMIACSTFLMDQTLVAASRTMPFGNLKGPPSMEFEFSSVYSTLRGQVVPGDVF